MGAAGTKACCSDGAFDCDSQQTVSVSRHDPEMGYSKELRRLDETTESFSAKAYDIARSPLEEPKDVAPIDAGSMPYDDSAKDLLEVILMKESKDDQLCMAVRHLKGLGRLVVLQIQAGGAIEKANRLNESQGRPVLAVGDTIVSVNGVEGNDGEIVAECKRKIELRLKVLPRST
mmetsp:Transcript_25964/g.60035  ORF Transcript_25964/g.60035 Transcript_25964/m.60035 type:complete len:175 (-) Transcript_25964:208-732(-)